MTSGKLPLYSTCAYCLFICRGSFLAYGVPLVLLSCAQSFIFVWCTCQVLPIVERLPEDTQKLMFSATVNDNVKKIATSLLQDPVTVTVGQVGLLARSLISASPWVCWSAGMAWCEAITWHLIAHTSMFKFFLKGPV